jgi:hypothetical protein
VNNPLTDVGPATSGRLLDRILALPHIAHLVPRLPAQLLHRVIQQCGLEDCGELLSLATPGQVAQLFDLDLWRPAAPGLDERFDGDRFGTWLEVMVEADVSRAAATLAAMDADLLAAAFIQHVRVFDSAAVSDYVTLDGEVSPGRAFDDVLSREVGGYLVAAKRTDFWDAITAVLATLAGVDGDGFTRVMRGCCRLSNSRPEPDVDDLPPVNGQAMFDQAVDRETRREAQGYVSPAQARAFLQASRRLDIRQGARPSRDPMTRAYFRSIEVHAVRPDEAPSEPSREGGLMRQAAEGAVAGIVDLLREAGMPARSRSGRERGAGPRALLEDPQAGGTRLGRIRDQLRSAHARDPDACAARNAELAYLANVVAAGSTLQSRAIPAEEAAAAAMAVCNLGLENWPVHWVAEDARPSPSAIQTERGLPDDFLVHYDLVSVFQVGWTVLHEDVCMYAADALLAVLTSLHCVDADVHAALATLRVTLTKHWRAGSPWESRNAFDVIALLDTPSWAALLGLIDEFPTLHAAVAASLARSAHHIDPAAFEFISENRQIRQVHAFMDLLPVTLRS